LLTLISGIIGFAAGIIAFTLYHLIGFLTNLFFYQKFDFSFASFLHLLMRSFGF
jgi:hypothetical protein